MNEEIIRVAFVENHEAVRTGISEAICKSGIIEVQIEARNGRELFTQLEKATTLPHVCLLEIGVPIMNGYETQRELVRRYPQIKTLVLTAHTSEQAINRMLSYGVRGYLSKDCRLKEIEEALISIYNTGTYYSKIAGNAEFKAIRNGEIKSPNFTDPEMEVLRLLPTELTYEEMAKKLGTTAKSVEGRRDSIFRKLKVNSRVAAALQAIDIGLITSNSDTGNL